MFVLPQSQTIPLCLLLSIATSPEIILPYLQRGGPQQRREYTVICNLFAASTLKLFRLLIVIVLLLGVAYFRRFCSTRIATGTLPLATVSTILSRPIVTVSAATFLPWRTVFVTIATAATSATVTAIAAAVSPSVVAIVRATAAIAADRVVLLRFCIESQA